MFEEDLWARDSFQHIGRGMAQSFVRINVERVGDGERERFRRPTAPQELREEADIQYL